MRNYGWIGRQKRIVMDRSSDNDRGGKVRFGNGRDRQGPTKTKGLTPRGGKHKRKYID